MTPLRLGVLLAVVGFALVNGCSSSDPDITDERGGEEGSKDKDKTKDEVNTQAEDESKPVDRNDRSDDGKGNDNSGRENEVPKDKTDGGSRDENA